MHEFGFIVILLPFCIFVSISCVENFLRVWWCESALFSLFFLTGTMTGFKTRTKVELGISSSSFRMLLDLTQPLRLPAICEMLNLPQPQLPDWFAKTGFTDELVLGVDLNSFEVEFKAGFNLFGVRLYLSFLLYRVSQDSAN